MRAPRRVLTPTLLILFLMHAPARAQAPRMKPEARALYDRGMAHFSAREWEAAVRAFQEAYRRDPRREILFAEAQATRLGGDCPGAVALYQRFLDTNPPERQVEATRLALARCATAPQSAPLPAAPVIVRASPPPSPPPPPWYRDRLAGSLVVAAVVAATASAAFAVSAARLDNQAQDQRQYDAYERHRLQAERRSTWARGTAFVGVALAAVAGGRWLWLSVGPGGVSVGGRH